MRLPSRWLPSVGTSLLCLAVAGPVSAIETEVSGEVRDPSGAVVQDAQITLLTSRQTVVRMARTDSTGAFSLSAVAPGSYLLVAAKIGFAPERRAIEVVESSPPRTLVVLRPGDLHEEVTVSANPGHVQAVGLVPQSVSVLDEATIAGRAKAVVAQVANEETGVHLQRTSPTMAGIFVRGLTGNKVNVFVDGFRYSTSAARGGVNTFLDLVDPAFLEGVEVLRGPTSAQYGSDALGGSVQFLTRNAPLSAVPATQGTWGTSFGSADLSYGSDLTVSRSTPRFGVLATLAGRRINTLRPGDGRDSHSAPTRFFGVPSDVAFGERLPDTAFTQYGGLLKARCAPGAGSQLVLSYTRSQQDGGKRYDQLLGGDGNLVADLRNLMLDRVTVKYERLGLGFFDRGSLGYSFGAQREERVNQGGNGNPRATVNHEHEKTHAHGVQGALEKIRGRHVFAVGGDFVHESVDAPSFGTNPVTDAVAARRGRVPDGARYGWGGIYVQDVFEAVPGRLRLVGSLRWSAASYEARADESPLVGGKPLWPDDELSVSSFTYRFGAVVPAGSSLTLTAHVGRGFRAPHVTDLGTLGLTGAGFEVSAPDVQGLRATVGTGAGETAVSTGRSVEQLEPETSQSYELGLRFAKPRFRTDLTVFRNDVKGNIQKQALILPAGSLGAALGDQTVSRQSASGTVFVPVSSSPVLVRANFDRARVWGVEHTLRATLSTSLVLSTVATYLHAEDRDTGRPPNIEGGTPAPEVWARMRWQRASGRYWVETYLHAAARQGRLSTLDLEDRRTGATRSRSAIAAFFDNGARVRGLVGPGADGVAGGSDDVLLATGETLAQVQARVLGPSGVAAPLFRAIPGYLVFGLRAGVRRGRHEAFLDLENLGDRNYRGIGWGMDAPGRGAFVRYAVRF